VIDFGFSDKNYAKNQEDWRTGQDTSRNLIPQDKGKTRLFINKSGGFCSKLTKITLLFHLFAVHD
jgi:hypothetical protein